MRFAWSAFHVAIVFTASIAATGCSPSIGDGCKTNVDCSRLGDRFCDTSAPNGYCTVDGCNQGTCPDGALCVRFLTADLDRPCDLGATFPVNGCRADERCVCDVSADGTSCQDGIAHCAPESTERRFCQKPCGSDTDCRPEFECRATGTLGAELVPPPSDALMTPASAKFCAPRA
jgi:hypothetical protein